MLRLQIAIAAVIIFLSPLYQNIAFSKEPLGTDDQGREYVNGEVIVKYRSLKKEAVERRARALWNSQSVEDFENTRLMRQRIPEKMTVKEAVSIFSEDPDIEYVEPNYIYRPSATPNDTYLISQWGLKNTGQYVDTGTGTVDADIDADNAWDLSTGSSNVVVAVIDSGVDYLHPDLSQNIWTNSGEISGNAIDDDGNGYVDDIIGWDFVNDDNAPMDGTGHGSHLTGIIAASGNNAFGIAGINWNSSIMVVRFINSAGYGTTADAIKAIEYARENGADVINCSWGGAGYSNALYDAINNTDALFVCAAGNQGVSLDSNPEYPAGFNSANIISVAASNQDDELAYFSNFSPDQVDVAAPGTAIYSTGAARETIWSDTFDDDTMEGWETGGTNNSWGVDLENEVMSDSPGGAYYQNDTDSWVIAPVFDLSSHLAACFEFNIIGSSESGSDILWVEASDDRTSWQRLPLNAGDIDFDQISGTLSFWQSATADLGAFDGSPEVYVRIRFTSNRTVQKDGFSIDNASLTVKEITTTEDEVTLKQGTSMSAAYVSGVAALILSEKTGLSPTEIKFLIENAVDEVPEHIGRTKTSGRINAYKALVSVASVDLNARASSHSRIDLSWIANAPVDSGFEIERRSEFEGEYQSIATLSTDNSQYLDNDLDQETTYYYRIHTLSSGVRAGYSNEAYTTTHSNTPASSGAGGGGGCFIRTSSIEKEPANPSFCLKTLLVSGFFLVIIQRIMQNQPH